MELSDLKNESSVILFNPLRQILCGWGDPHEDHTPHDEGYIIIHRHGGEDVNEAVFCSRHVVMQIEEALGIEIEILPI